jgi:hypothetical protein
MRPASSWRPALSHALVALFLVLSVTACGGEQTQAEPAPKLSTPSSTEPAEDPGVEVTGLPEGVDFEITDTNVGVENGENLNFVSPVYSLALTGVIRTPVTVRVQLDNALPVTTSLLVATRVSDSQPWTYLPGKLTTDQLHVEYTARTLNQVGVLAVNPAATFASFRQDFVAGLSSRVNAAVKKPTCEDPDVARAKDDGYSIAVSKSPTLFVCFGMQDEKRILKVTNRRVVPIQVAHPEVAEVKTPPVAGSYTTWQPFLPEANTFLTPGRTVVYDAELEPEAALGLTAASGAEEQSLRLLQAGVRALVIRVARTGGGTTNVNKAVKSLLARPACAGTIGQGPDALVAGCFSPQKVVQAFGQRATLLRPMVSLPNFTLLFRRQAKAIAAAQPTEAQRIVVRRAAPDFTRFVGFWSGRSRLLAITKDGVVTEQVNDDQGALIIRLTYRLTEPKTAEETARADAVVTRVKLGQRKLVKGRVPRVGDKGALTLTEGVVRPPFLKTNYCNVGQAKQGNCGL